MRLLRPTALSAIVALALAAGCSLANSLDDVVPPNDGKFASVPRPTPTSVVEDAGPPPSVDASEAAAPAGTFTPLVVGGVVARDGGVRAPVLAVLDSKTGREVGTRETMWVAGVAHDGPRDLWYIFEGPSFFVVHPTEKTKLHIRRLDRTTGVWTELALLDDLAPLTFYDAIALTNERVSFVAHPAVGNTFRLVTIDTSNPAAPVASSTLNLLANPRAIIATRGSVGAGGTINVYTTGSNPPPSDAGTDAGANECTQYPQPLGTVCKMRVREILVPATAGAEPFLTGDTHLFGDVAQQGQPGYASLVCGGAPDDITVLPMGDGKQTVYRRPFGSNTTNPASARTFDMNIDTAAPTFLRRSAVDNARKLVFVVEANSDTNIHAVSLEPGVSPLQEPLLHSGQSVYYDPSSETVFSPFNQGDGFTFSPFRVTGTAASPRLQVRTATTPDAPWNPPADLRPNILGIFQPLDLACP